MWPQTWHSSVWKNAPTGRQLRGAGVRALRVIIAFSYLREKGTDRQTNLSRVFPPPRGPAFKGKPESSLPGRPQPAPLQRSRTLAPWHPVVSSLPLRQGKQDHTPSGATNGLSVSKPRNVINSFSRQHNSRSDIPEFLS